MPARRERPQQLRQRGDQVHAGERRVAPRKIVVAEVQQGAIFLVKGFDEQELGPLLGIGAPNALFPYAREVVSDLVTRGSFPQLVLQPVNFEAMYAQQVAAEQQQGNAETH